MVFCFVGALVFVGSLDGGSDCRRVGCGDVGTVGDSVGSSLGRTDEWKEDELNCVDCG